MDLYLGEKKAQLHMKLVNGNEEIDDSGKICV